MIGAAVNRAVTYIGEKYMHGVFVGFGIMSANAIFRYGMAFGKSVKVALAEIDLEKTRREARERPDAVIFWRKSN